MKGNLLTFSLLSATPDYLSGRSAWIQHIPFAFLVIEALRPDTFVELGSHFGDSYCAFCQAAKTLELPMRAFAIDTWEGDQHAGFYGQEVYDQMKLVHDEPYGHFSEMKRMKPMAPLIYCTSTVCIPTKQSSMISKRGCPR